MARQGHRILRRSRAFACLTEALHKFLSFFKASLRVALFCRDGGRVDEDLAGPATNYKS